MIAIKAVAVAHIFVGGIFMALYPTWDGNGKVV